MIRMATPLAVAALLAMGCEQSTAAEPKGADAAETKYLTFQLMTGLHGFAGPQPMPGHFALSKVQLEGFVHDLVKMIGATGDARHKLGFAVGPSVSDNVRQGNAAGSSTILSRSPGKTM